jgi:phosphotransferase system HPr (HPr) family protein
MTSTDLAFRDRYGLHPRAAMRIQQAAGRFRSRVTIRGQAGQGTEVDARSMISLVGAGIGPGEIVRLTADGDDEAEALAAVRDLIGAGVCHP